MSIPRKIHQGWIGPKPMPERETAWCAAMKQMNPDFEHKVFGNEVLDRYGRDPYVSELVSQCEAWAFICDRIRCLLLRDEGGIWLDPDCQPIRPLSRLDHIWNDSKVQFVTSFRHPLRPGVALHRGVTLADNTFMASAPGSRDIKRVMEAWTPLRPLVNGHDIGIQTLIYGEYPETAWLPYKYFYDLTTGPDTLVLHDCHNSGSWCAQQKEKKLGIQESAMVS